MSDKNLSTATGAFAAHGVPSSDIVRPMIEVRWLGDRRCKFWCRFDDPSDPILCNGLQGSARFPRKDIEWINLKGDPHGSNGGSERRAPARSLD